MKSAVKRQAPSDCRGALGYTSGMLEDRFPPGLGEPLRFAGIAVAGVVLAMLAVYAGTALLDGFGDWDLHRLGRRFRRSLRWVLPLAVLAGIALYAYYRRLLQPGVSGLVMLISVVRAFVHFPLYGGLALFAIGWGFAESFGRRLLIRWGHDARPPADAESILEHWLGPPVWFIFLPFMAMKLPLQGDLEIPQTISRRRLLRWLPGTLALILFYTGGVSEDTGERVDPYWLVAFASVWLGDYLMVALRIAPVLRARRHRPQAGTTGQ